MYMDGWHGSYPGPAKQCLVFITSTLTLDSQGKMAAAVIVSLIMGVLNGALGAARLRLQRKMPLKPGTVSLGADGAALALYTLQLSNAYGMMLLVMTYYAGFFFAIVIGLAVGQLVFLRPSASAQKQDTEQPLLGGVENVDPCCPTEIQTQVHTKE